MIVLNICKEDINWKEAKNGKSYANVATDFLKEPDDKGNTHTVWNNQSPEERAEKAKKNYCGRGKQVSYNAPSHTTVSSIDGLTATINSTLPTGKKEYAVNQQESEDDLPF